VINDPYYTAAAAAVAMATTTTRDLFSTRPHDSPNRLSFSPVAAVADNHVVREFGFFFPSTWSICGGGGGDEYEAIYSIIIFKIFVITNILIIFTVRHEMRVNEYFIGISRGVKKIKISFPLPIPSNKDIPE